MNEQNLTKMIDKPGDGAGDLPEAPTTMLPPDIPRPRTEAEMQAVFLVLVLERTHTELGALQALGISGWTLRRWRRSDPVFAMHYLKAREISAQELEHEAARRALAGSDRLMEFMLASIKPDVYGRRNLKIEHTVNDEALALLRAAKRRAGLTIDGESKEVDEDDPDSLAG